MASRAGYGTTATLGDERSPAENLERLRRHLAGHGPVVVAYSGGVDSALVAAVAHEVLDRRALIVTALSPAVARREVTDAAALAAERGWNYRTVRTNEGEREEYARNEPDRCYWCKTELFDVLEPVAAAVGARIVVGTNADDLGDYRPGLRAASERAVATPLADLGLRKRDVRAMCELLALPVADKPASPCLASRFAYGVRVTPERLEQVDRAEEFIRSLGVRELRVRVHGDVARIEVPEADISRVVERRSDIEAKLRELGFRYVALDLGGFRSGSLNEVLTPTLRRGETGTPRS